MSEEPNLEKVADGEGPPPEGSNKPSEGPEKAIAKDFIRHDIYFVSNDDVLYKFPVDQETGRYGCPETPAYSDPNLRHVHNLANPGLTDDPPGVRGPVLATLPVTEEPTAASVITCYVINPNNLIYRNAYTAEEWFSAGAEETPGPTIPDEFDLIVAGPKGRIFHLHVEGEKASCRKLQPDELKHETDVWDQLRNGTVVGRVLFEKKVVPMINVTSVQPGKTS